MNSRQLDTILRSCKATKKYFLGVFSSNTIPLHTKHHYPYCFVANTERAGQQGQHWVACWVKSAKSIEYFDSLGEHPNPDLRVYLDKFKKVMINKHAFQFPLSDSCGHYCVYFLVCRSTDIPFCQIMETLQKTSSLSDILVKHFVRMIMRV